LFCVRPQRGPPMNPAPPTRAAPVPTATPPVAVGFRCAKAPTLASVFPAFTLAWLPKAAAPTCGLVFDGAKPEPPWAALTFRPRPCFVAPCLRAAAPVRRRPVAAPTALCPSPPPIAERRPFSISYPWSIPNAEYISPPGFPCDRGWTARLRGSAPSRRGHGCAPGTPSPRPRCGRSGRRYHRAPPAPGWRPPPPRFLSLPGQVSSRDG